MTQKKMRLCAMFALTAAIQQGLTACDAGITDVSPQELQLAFARTTTVRIARVNVTPEASTLAVGGGVQLVATVLDNKGNVITGTQIRWTSLNPAVAQVDAAGRATALAGGTALITGAAGDRLDTAHIAVQSATAPLPPAPEPAPAPVPSGAAELPRVYVDTRMPATTQTVRVAAGGDLQAAINAAAPGTTILLPAGATYTGNFNLPKKVGDAWVVIRTETALPAEGVRVTPAAASGFARILSPNMSPAIQTAPGAHHYRFIGVTAGWAPGVATGYSLVSFGAFNSGYTLADEPHHLVLDRVLIDGGATNFQRCVLANASHFAVIDSYLANCHGKGYDSQAVAAWNAAGPFKIVNNYLEGAGENVMFGGSDARIQGLVPSDIEMRRNHVRKPLAWRGVWTVKNIFELKNAARVLVEGNVFENNWLDGQGGTAILFTPRNQDGGNPWAVVRDVTFRNNILRRTGSAFGILGYDYNYPSQVTTNIVIENNLMEEINGSVYGGSGMGFLINYERPSNLVIRNNTIGNSGTMMMLDGNDATRKMDRLVFTGNVAASGRLSAGPEAGTGALNFSVASWTVTGNVLAGVSASLYPAGNTYLSSTLGYAGPEGVDRTALNAATAGVAQP